MKKRVFFTYIGENSLYVYILHGFLGIAIRTYNAYMHPVFKRTNTRGEKLVYILFGIALTFFLASPMVVKMFKWIFEPEIDLKLGKTNTGGSRRESK